MDGGLWRSAGVGRCVETGWEPILSFFLEGLVHALVNSIWYILGFRSGSTAGSKTLVLGHVPTPDPQGPELPAEWRRLPGASVCINKPGGSGDYPWEKSGLPHCQPFTTDDGWRICARWKAVLVMVTGDSGGLKMRA